MFLDHNKLKLFVFIKLMLSGVGEKSSHFNEDSLFEMRMATV